MRRNVVAELPLHLLRLLLLRRHRLLAAVAMLAFLPRLRLAHLLRHHLLLVLPVPLARAILDPASVGNVFLPVHLLIVDVVVDIASEMDILKIADAMLASHLHLHPLHLALHLALLLVLLRRLLLPLLVHLALLSVVADLTISMKLLRLTDLRTLFVSLIFTLSQYASLSLPFLNVVASLSRVNAANRT